MTEDAKITDDQLEVLRGIPTQTIIDALWVEGLSLHHDRGGAALAHRPADGGVALLPLRYVPHRPDLAEDKPKGEESAEYVAFELCGPTEVLVIDALGWKYSSVGGDIKFFRLFRRKVGGLVTDGSVRDSVSLLEYGFPVYSYSTTAKQGPADFWPWQVNDAIHCGGVLVRPGDGVVGDDDGAVVVPRAMVNEVIRLAEERHAVEEVVKAQLAVEDVSPGKYYPFNDRTWELYELKTGKKRGG